MYAPAATFRRADAERPDRQASWRRDDQAFFAAEASHVLAFAAASVFAQLHVVALRQRGKQRAAHAIASDGTWAFDHAGWTRQDEITATTARLAPGEVWELVPVTGGLADCCRAHGFTDPHEFAHDPWWRAIAYLAKFPPPPRVSRGWKSAAARVPAQRRERDGDLLVR